MSPYSTSKTNKSFFQSYFWTVILALFMAVVLSQWAVADPQATQEQTDPPPVEEPLEIPPIDDSAIKTEENSEATPRIVEPVPDAVITRVPKSYDGSATESDAMHDENTQMIQKIPLAEKCYEQKDGSFECVCEGSEECETLKTAEHCEPGTHWGKDGYGGCTRKSSE